MSRHTDSRSIDNTYAPLDAWKPGANSSVTQAPPTISRRSSTTARRPARVSEKAATSPLWPPPTTIASWVVTPGIFLPLLATAATAFRTDG